MPIPVITNFSINSKVPFDTRLVATSSAALDAMLYKYEGLTTYRTDTKLNYTYNGSAWAVSSNGIYGGGGNLGTSSTIINLGTFSTTVLNDVSKKLTFKSYTDDTGVNSLRLENYFERHSTSYSGVSYKSQFIFSESDDQGLYYGSYIMYNPRELFNSGKGGISFGVIQGVVGQQDIELPPYERMRIDGNGIIRFKPNATVNDATKSVNIGIDSTNTRPFIGFNWNGSTPDVGLSASYVQFDNSVFSIHHFSNGTGTHSAIFSRGLVKVNGFLQVSRTITTNSDIEFGFGSSTGGKILNNLSGIIVNSSSVVSLVARKSTSIKGQGTTISSFPVITYDVDSITTNVLFNARNATNIWDNNFDPVEESSWYLYEENGGQPNNSILVVVVPSDTVVEGSVFSDFTFTLLGPYNENQVVSSWYLESQLYDRYLYFYKEGDGTELPISHLVEWFLSKDDGLGNWVKIGQHESGNINDDSIPFRYIDYVSIYQTRYYAQSVIIPANMLFKIGFTFNSTYYSNPVNYSDRTFTVKTRIIRSGKF